MEPEFIRQIHATDVALKEALAGPRKAPKQAPAGRSRRGAIETQQVEVYWTLKHLAKEAKLTEAAAKKHLLKANILEQPRENWRWLATSKELKRVRQVLGLDKRK